MRFRAKVCSQQRRQVRVRVLLPGGGELVGEQDHQEAQVHVRLALCQSLFMASLHVV